MIKRECSFFLSAIFLLIALTSQAHALEAVGPVAKGTDVPLPIVEGFECTVKAPGGFECSIKAEKVWGFKLTPTEVEDFTKWITSTLKGFGLLSDNSKIPGDFKSFEVDSPLISTINQDGTVTVAPISPIDTPQDLLVFGGFSIELPSGYSYTGIQIEGTAQGSSGFTEALGFSSIPVPTAVPLPGAMWLFSAGVLGLFRLSRRKFVSAL
ncbi:hypothetical protein [Methylomonas sp. CM2]|uniref:hypothetical protein n=1 Tax=Methylomonas sp. CM2 TaxID=3417647 RepID=UPI003CE67B03